jgi:hypothetical protein
MDLSGILATIDRIQAIARAGSGSATDAPGIGFSAVLEGVVGTDPSPAAPTGADADPTVVSEHGWAAALPAQGRRWVDAIVSAARLAGLDPRLLAALVWAESSFRSDAVSGAGAIGLTQLMPGTAASLHVDPRDPIQNLRGGAQYLAAQIRRFGSLELGLAAYNAGPGAVDAAGGVPDTARAYVERVLGYLDRLGVHARPVENPMLIPIPARTVPHLRHPGAAGATTPPSAEPPPEAGTPPEASVHERPVENPMLIPIPARTVPHLRRPGAAGATTPPSAEPPPEGGTPPPEGGSPPPEASARTEPHDRDPMMRGVGERPDGPRTIRGDGTPVLLQERGLSGPDQRGAAPATAREAVERVLEVVQRIRDQAPPRQVVVELPEMDGLRVLVETRASTVHVRPVGGDPSGVWYEALVRDLGPGLAARGFDLAGDPSGGGPFRGRPGAEDQWTPVASPSPPAARIRSEGVRL